MDEFVLRAVCASVMLAIILGPLGSLVVWRRMAYFGDTIAHSALLGVAISLLSNGAIPMIAAMMGVALTVAGLLNHYTRDRQLQSDTVLGILAHVALALGIVLVALTGRIRVDMNAYLFGDILAISWEDVALIGVMVVAVGFILAQNWRSLLIATIEPTIAAVDGVNVKRQELLLTLILAIVIAMAIKLTGILLITALLLIPAAAARRFARTPICMAMLASLAGIIATTGGLGISLLADTPTGPSMVLVAGALVAFSHLNKRPI